MGNLSYRRLFAWAVLCCTLSAMCGLGKAYGLGCAIAVIFACPLLACWHGNITVSDLSLKIIVTRLILLLLPFLSFFEASFVTESLAVSAKKSRHNHSQTAWFEQNQQATVMRDCGKRIVLTGDIERIVVLEDFAVQIVLVQCGRVTFPDEHAVTGRACFILDRQKEPAKLASGQLISVACYLRSSKFSVPKKSSLGEAAYKYLQEYKKSFDTFSLVSAQDITVLPEQRIAPKLDLQPLVTFCREQIAEKHKQTLGPEKGALLTSMVLGQNAVDLPKNIVENFRDVGLSHIVAASGFNLSIVVLVTYFLLRPLNLPGNRCEYCCLIMMAIYVALAGLSSSIARAALMSSFIILSRMTQRRIGLGAALAAALLVTWLPSPLVLSDVGLQLSYVATIGIVVGARPLGQLLNSRPNRFYQKCADTLAVTIIAQLSVLPIQLYYFGTIGLSSLAANLLVVPSVEIITMFGFAASILVLIGSIAPILSPIALPLVNRIDQGLFYPLSYIVWITNTFSSVQCAKLKLQQPSINVIAVYYLCIVSSLFLLRFPDKKIWVFILVSVGIAVLTLSRGF
jgi:ComEC/Rec2-related protein